MPYLDCNASTPLDPRVLEVMHPVLTGVYANPSSAHRAGQKSAESVERARAQLAGLIHSDRRDILFTSGATEAAALAILGIAWGAPTGRQRIIVSATEHKAVLEAAATAGELAHVTVETAPVKPNGQVDLDWLKYRLKDDVLLVAVMAANNETGVLNPVSDVAVLAKQVGALTLVDITQAVGRIAVDLHGMGIDLAVLSAHKMYGPKGVGALIASRSAQRLIRPVLHGGGQERGLRGGTLNVPGIVGFGEAAAIAGSQLHADAALTAALSDQMWRSLQGLAGVERVGETAPRLPNTLSVRFVGADADAIISGMPDVAVSSGSACQSGVPAPSHVLLAMGMDHRSASECIRFSFGRFTTNQEIKEAVAAVIREVTRVRSLSAYAEGVA